MAINVPLQGQLQNTSQLTQQVQNALNAVRINLGGAGGARSLSALSQPLGRLTGQADEFTKSLDAANARVLAFGASVGVVNAVSNAFKALVNSTIEVEKAIIAISVVGDKFTGKSKELSQGLFSIAKATGQSFAEVSKAALEFARQGEGVEETLKRTKDALILTRTTGLDAAKSVDGLTAAVNAFAKAGLSTTQVINKLAAVDQAFAVSSADLIEAFQRTGAVAQQAGVSFDELAGIVTALQTETSRGGAVIGNALKTIFSRLQDTSTLKQLQNLGIAVQDLQGNILPARQILQNLAGDLQGLSKITQAGVFKEVAGTFQLNQLVSLVNDLNKAQSISAAATAKSAGATNEAYIANEKLNQSLDAIFNKLSTTGKQLGSLLGEIGLSDNIKGLLDGISSFLESVNNTLQGDDIGSKFAKGFVKGIGAVLSGPGLGVFLAIIVKLSYDLLKFGAQSLKTFLNIGRAASDQKQIQESIVQTLLKNENLLNSILSTQGGQNAQALKFLGILNQQASAMQLIQGLAGNIASTAYSSGYRPTAQGLQRKAAGGYLPAQEASDVKRGVGGASPSSKVVAIPNFAFGGGQRGTMIANTSEYIVPNYAGGGSAIFNQDMVKTMGLPAGAKKIGAAGGFVPNFAAQQKNISFDNYSAEKLLKKAKSFEQINRVDLSKDDFNGNINIIRQQLTNDEYNASAQDITKKIIPTLGKSTGKVINDKYLEEQIASFEKQGIDPFSIKRLKTSIFNATPNNGGFLNIRNQIKGIIGEIDASVLSGQSLTSGNADLDLAGGGEVKTRRRTPLSNLIKKSANNLLRIKNFNNNTPDSIGLPNLDVYLPKGGSIDKSASNGYIPNFANYIFDRDKIPSGLSGTILNSILASSKRKDLIVGPAGSGKSTVAAGLGTFIKTLDDLNKATSFTVLSSSGLSSKGALTEPFQNILSAVNRSGGKTTYLATANEELKKRRASRTLSGGDVRSAGELSGALYAPLNQRSFIKQLKKESSNFELMRQKNTSGFKNSDLAVLGLYGQKGSVNGSSVYTLNSERPDLTKDIKKEYEVRVKSFVRSYSQELANKIGIKRSPKEVKKALQQSSSVSGFIFEDVLNQLSGGFNTASLSGGSRIDFQMTPNLKTVFGTGGEKYAEAKLNPYSSDAVQSIIEKQNALASGRASLPQKTSNVQSIKAQWFAYQNRENKREGFEDFNSIARSLNINPTVGSKSSITDKINAALKSAATGYIPNFADLDGDGVVTQRDGFYTRLKSAAKKYSKNPAVDFVLNQIIQSTLGLPEGIEVMGIVRACDQALEAVKPEDELNKILRQKSAAKKSQKRQGFLKSYYNSSAGYVPNFAAAALQQAIAREKSAGLSNSQIYVDQNPSLKSSLNPMGLMVANTRDEPSGGIQGISRARKEGANPKTYGAANGFVPNYALQAPIGQVSAIKGILKQDKVDAFNKALEETAKQLKNNQISLSQAEQNIEIYAQTVGTSTKGQKILESEGKKLIQAYDRESQARKQKAKELTQQRKDGQGSNSKQDGKGFGDTAGKIIILQSALAFLSSAVGEGESSIEKFTQRLVQSSGNITSLAFLGKEIGNINIEAKGMKGALGNFAKGIGLAGIAVGITVEGFKLADFALKEFSGENKRAADALAELETAAQGALISLNDLTPSGQRAAQQSGEFALQSFSGSFLSNLFTEASGKNPEIQKQISLLSAQGINPKDLKSLLEKETIKTASQRLSETPGRLYTGKSPEEIIKLTQLDKIISSVAKIDDLSKAISNLFQNPSVIKSGKALATVREKFKGGEFRTETTIADIQAAIPESKNVDLKILQSIIEANKLNLSLKKGIAEEERNLALGERINIDLAKQKLENMLEQKKAAIDINTYSGTSSLRFQLEALDVSEKYKNSLEKQIKLKEIDGELSKKNLDIVKSAIDQLTSLPSGSSLGVSATQFSGIKDVLKDSNIQTPEQFTNAINSIGNQLGLNPAQLKNVNAFFVDQISNAKKLADAQKISTENTAAFNEKIIDTKNILESLSAVRKRELEYQAKYAEELRGLNDEEIIAAKKRQILEQRSGKRGFERGLDTIQDRINNYRVTLGEEIPNLFSSNLAQGLNDAISGAKDLKTALTDAATSFFQEITRKNISNLADMVTGGIGGIGGFFTKKASGGLISGGSGTKDDVPAMLMGGEYVLKKSSVSKYGKGFLDAINSGSMRGYATGGIVDPQTFPTQTGSGGFFTPGDYGQGAITGKNELLTFATQSNTGGQYDYMGGFGTGGATVSLEPESARLSSFGRENSPMFERVQQSKDEAFRVYLEGLQKEKEYADLLEQIAKDKKARKKALQTAIISAVATTALSYAGSAFSAGAKNTTAASIAGGGKGGFLTSLKGGVSNLGNLFKPSKALGLSADTKFLESIGVSSYKDLSSGKVSSEDSLKLFQKYPNLGKSYTFSRGAYRASGGLISGGSNIRDDVPAMLTGGEFVLNNRATQRIGTQNLHKLNSGAQIGGESSSAETTQALISKLDELIQTTANSSKENVVVNVSTSEADGQKQENPAGTEKELQKKIREAVLNVIAQEKRLGGSLEKSR